ncbi:uncharacterized protein LOC114712540 [Neltuma alba]|uniref:uncharacterized protein LOC114712540 n=1 Tax=Neltuma alba TaxID=207710 RepID=UPI0010A585DD|nr:uncharacterized protein LOC114712540 [Prosopis alba]
MAVAVAPWLAAVAPEAVEVLPVVASVNPVALGLMLGVGAGAAVLTLLYTEIRSKTRTTSSSSNNSNNNNNCCCPCHMAEGLLKTLKPLIKKAIKEMLMKPLDPEAEKAADDVIAEIEKAISDCGCDGKLKEIIKNIIKENKETIKALLKKGYKEVAVGREAGEIAEQVTNYIEMKIKDKLSACNCCGQKRG